MSLVQMNPRENIGKRVMILPSSAVMDFYFRQVGKIIDVIDCVGETFYLIEFQKTSEALNAMQHHGLELSKSDGFAGDLMGVFPVNANFLKFI